MRQLRKKTRGVVKGADLERRRVKIDLLANMPRMMRAWAKELGLTYPPKRRRV
jgi:hypothetical protein